MIADHALLQVLTAGVAGLVLSVIIEQFLHPRPRLVRPIRIWSIHAGLWCAAYTFPALLLGRPWCAMTATLAIMITLILVSNAKQKNLREPFLFQDYDYFWDALRFPRLFLPFLGLKNFCFAAVCFVLALFALWQEAPPPSRLALNGQFGGIIILLICAAALLWWGKADLPHVSFDPEKDIRLWGLLPSLWVYGAASRRMPEAHSPFDHAFAPTPNAVPHLVAVQSESFFDARTLFAGIKPDVLCAFDVLRTNAFLCGDLSVPAWGANTVRTEFSFLTGIPAQSMGVHRFNPYQSLLRGWTASSLPLFLKKLGYRTVCIHPYWSQYYGRNRVLKRLGFDMFLDIGAFGGVERTGAYIGDMEVGKCVLRVLRESVSPTFIFAITMENHGPLHLDHIPAEKTASFYSVTPKTECSELGAYLYHLKNADRMLDLLHKELVFCNVPVSLCFYGDHVPIMPDVYKIFMEPDGTVPYFCWNNYHTRDLAQGIPTKQELKLKRRTLAVHDLAQTWLESNLTGLMYRRSL